MIKLLREHLAGMHAESPPDKEHALDLGALRQTKITFVTAWRQGSAGQTSDQLVACCAHKKLDPHHGGIKSLAPVRNTCAKGAAQTTLTELTAIARRRSYARVNLETQSTPGR